LRGVIRSITDPLKRGKIATGNIVNDTYRSYDSYESCS
jgi:hypothetical protein